MKLIKRRNKRFYIIQTVAVVCAAGIALAMTAKVFSADNGQNGGVSYQDATAKYATLTAGITRTAPLSFDVHKQTFDLDTVAMTGDEAMTLQIQEVLVGKGQQVEKGTPLFRVTSDSVQQIRAKLQQQVLDTSRTRELLKARQKELRLQASQQFDSDKTDGKYAAVVYNSRCDALQKEADEAKEAVDHKQNQVNETLLELSQAQQELAQAQTYFQEAQAAVYENYDNRYNDAYYYTVYEQTRQKAQDMVKQLEDKIEALTQKNESLLYEINEAVCAYHQIVQELEKEKLAARLDRDTKIYDSETASEWYDIQMEALDNALGEAEERYQTALQNIRAFQSGTASDCVRANYKGVLTDIAVTAGSSVKKNDTLVTFYDQEEAQMAVWLEREEFPALDMDQSVNITFSAYPDKIYEGKITQVSDVKDADAKRTDAKRTDAKVSGCRAIITVQGDMTRLSEGIMGEVTFLTNETKEVLCVPRRAVYTSGKHMCVKLRNLDGKIVKRRVTTGISDGIYVEIVEGISQGDTVLVEIP